MVSYIDGSRPIALAVQDQPRASTGDGADGAAMSPEARGGIEDIVVTAQRRQQRLQEVPLSVNVATAAALDAKGIRDLSPQTFGTLVPAFTGTTVAGRGALFLRGVGNNAVNPNNEPSVALYVDGVYMASPQANMMSFNNIERVEVLKGPQGTLFGRNATGGVIQVITRDPSMTDVALEARAGYGNYDTVRFSGYASTPLASTLAIDLAVQYESRADGFGRNIPADIDTQKQKSFGVRSKLVWEPTDETQVKLSGDYGYFSTNTPPQHPAGVPNPNGVFDPPTDGFDNYVNFLPGLHWRRGGGSLEISHDFKALRVVSISAYRVNNGVYLLDGDTGSQDLVNVDAGQRQTNFSQELQLLSPSGSPVEWIVGGYYFDSDASFGDRGQTLTGAAFGPAVFSRTLASQKSVSKSLYGQATIEVFEGTRLTGGLRYTTEKQRLAGRASTALNPDPAVVKQRVSYEKVTWRIALDQELARDVHAYASFNRGIKSGGFTLGSPALPGYAPETLDAYEIGIKSDLFGRTLRLNMSGFYYDFKDIQYQQTLPGAIPAVRNAAAARISGLDVDFEVRPIDALSITGGFVLLDSKFKRFPGATFFSDRGAATIVDASGRKLPFAAPFNGNIGATYRIDSAIGDISLSGTVSYNDGFYWAPSNRTRQDSYTLVNANLRWESRDERLSAELWINNLTDARYDILLNETSLGDHHLRADPRTYGVTIGFKL